MQGLKMELFAFLTAFFSGMTVACAYLCIRKLRRVIPHSLAAVGVEDGIYWTGTAIYIFAQIYSASSGGIRWYFVIGAGLGLLAFLLSGRLFRKLGSRLYKKKKQENRKKY